MTREPELSIRSAAKVLGVNRRTLTAWIYRREVIERWRKTVSGRFLIPSSEVARVKRDRERRYEPSAPGESAPSAQFAPIRSEDPRIGIA